jgi:hypothetical protein
MPPQDLPTASEVARLSTHQIAINTIRDRGLLFSGEGELVPLKTTMAVPAGDLAALEPFVD